MYLVYRNVFVLAIIGCTNTEGCENGRCVVLHDQETCFCNKGYTELQNKSCVGKKIKELKRTICLFNHYWFIL